MCEFYSKQDLNLLKRLIPHLPPHVGRCSGGLLEPVNGVIIPPDGCGTETRWLITKWPDQGKSTLRSLQANMYMLEVHIHFQRDMWLGF